MMKELIFNSVTLILEGEEEIFIHYKNVEANELLKILYDLEKEYDKIFIDEVETNEFYDEFIQKELQGEYATLPKLFESLKYIICTIQDFYDIDDAEKVGAYNYLTVESCYEGIMSHDDLLSYIEASPPEEAFDLGASSSICWSDNFFIFDGYGHVKSIDRDIDIYYSDIPKEEAFNYFLENIL